MEGAMTRWFRLTGSLVALAAVCAACAPGGSGAARSSDAVPSAGGGQKSKQIVVAMMGSPSSFVARMNGTSNTVPGVVNLQQLVNAALGEQTKDHTLTPLLAEAIPSIENG